MAAVLVPPPPDIGMVQQLRLPMPTKPPTAALPPSLRNIFQPSDLRTLEGLREQIETQTLSPLFMAEPRQGLTEVFRLVYPRFFSYYTAATQTLLARVKEPELLGQFVTFSFEALRAELMTEGPARLERQALIAALIGVRSMTQVVSAAAGPAVTDDSALRERLEGVAQQFTAESTAYMLTILAVSHALNLGDGFRGRSENVAILARWSQAYAARVYGIAVRCGLLRLPQRPPGPFPSGSTEEDVQLAEAGLEEYVELLRVRLDAGDPETR
jgi:hypothetical protein